MTQEALQMTVRATGMVMQFRLALSASDPDLSKFVNGNSFLNQARPVRIFTSSSNPF